MPVADPGFPEGGGYQPQSLWQTPIIWQDYCQKLHENERNWTEREGPSIPINQCMQLI